MDVKIEYYPFVTRALFFLSLAFVESIKIDYFVFQDQQRDFAIEGLHYNSKKPQRLYDRCENSKNNHYGLQAEEREGETSGYASDSIEAPASMKGSKLV